MPTEVGRRERCRVRRQTGLLAPEHCHTLHATAHCLRRCENRRRLAIECGHAANPGSADVPSATPQDSHLFPRLRASRALPGRTLRFGKCSLFTPSHGRGSVGCDMNDPAAVTHVLLRPLIPGGPTQPTSSDQPLNRSCLRPPELWTEVRERATRSMSAPRGWTRYRLSQRGPNFFLNW